MLDQHLDGCPECRALLADFQKIHQELSDMTVTPPAALCQGVMDRIKAEEAAEKVVPIRRKARPWVRWGAAAAVFAVVVLGAGVNGTAPSLSLEVRLEAALDYIADKPDIPIVVTGSQGPGEDISEAQCMADWLMDRGVAAERILLEDQADNTEENIKFSQAMLRNKGIDTAANIAVVTSDYHLCRAALLWGAPRMVPVAAHMPEAYWPLTVNYFVREAFAVAAEIVF